MCDRDINVENLANAVDGEVGPSSVLAIDAVLDIFFVLLSCLLGCGFTMADNQLGFGHAMDSLGLADAAEGVHHGLMPFISHLLPDRLADMGVSCIIHLTTDTLGIHNGQFIKGAKPQTQTAMLCK